VDCMEVIQTWQKLILKITTRAQHREWTACKSSRHYTNQYLKVPPVHNTGSGLHGPSDMTQTNPSQHTPPHVHLNSQEVDRIEGVLYPLLRQDLARQGPRFVVDIGDKQIDYNETFRCVVCLCVQSHRGPVAVGLSLSLFICDLISGYRYSDSCTNVQQVVILSRPCYDVFLPLFLLCIMPAQLLTCYPSHPSPLALIVFAQHQRNLAIGAICRVGQSRKYTPYMIVYSVISLPKVPYIHRIHMVLANLSYMLWLQGSTCI